MFHPRKTFEAMRTRLLTRQTSRGKTHVMMQSTRKAKGLTQEELAARARVSLRTVQRAEQGGTPRRAQQHAIAEVLGVSAEDLFHPNDATTPENRAIQSHDPDRSSPKKITAGV